MPRFLVPYIESAVATIVYKSTGSQCADMRAHRFTSAPLPSNESCENPRSLTPHKDFVYGNVSHIYFSIAWRARICAYTSFMASRFLSARLCVPSCNAKGSDDASSQHYTASNSGRTLCFAYLYMRFSELAPPVFIISRSRFSYGLRPATSATTSRTTFTRWPGFCEGTMCNEFSQFPS